MIYPETFEQKIGFSEIKKKLESLCISSMGLENVKGITFLTNERLINKKLEETHEMRSFMQEDDFSTDCFYDLRDPLLRIRPEGTFLDESELLTLKKSLDFTITLIRLFSEKKDNGTFIYPTIYNLCSKISTFPSIIKEIDEVLNKYGNIKDSASIELSQIRHNIESTTRNISNNLHKFIFSAQKEGYIKSDMQPTIRDGRLVIPINPALKRKIKGIIHDESATGKTIFIEPDFIVEANNRIRELKEKEKQEIIRILQRISNNIRKSIPLILPTYDFLGLIDFIRAKALLSQEIQGIELIVNKGPIIDWVKAIHPLLQKSLSLHGKKMTPLDIRLNPQQKLLIISGPNAGGKSICLKTVGLLQYMLQCGLSIPLQENSKVGIFNSIFIDIGDEQSIEKDLSTYSSHLYNMKAMIKMADNNSLILIDEFGGGTEPQKGSAIAEAILKQFIKKQLYGIITTHYQNLKYYANEHPGIINGAMLYDRQNMRPLYQLQIGIPGSSFAIEILKQIGFPQEVINDALEIIGDDNIQSDQYIQDAIRDKRYWENKRKEIHLKEKKLDQKILQYEKEIDDLRKNKADLLQKAKEEALMIINASNSKIEKTIKGIKESQANKDETRVLRKDLESFRKEIENNESFSIDNKIDLKIKQIEQRRKRKEERLRLKKQTDCMTPISNSTKTKEKSIQIGDYVRIKGQEAIGVLKEIKKQQALIVFGNMQLWTRFDQLEISTAPSKISKTPSYSKDMWDSISQKRLSFKPEIDIRGMRGEEAIKQVTLFIDDATLLGFNPVRILHGTGDGILRNLIREYLSTLPHISYRDEHIQLGGHGITVVFFQE